MSDLPPAGTWVDSCRGLSYFKSFWCGLRKSIISILILFFSVNPSSFFPVDQLLYMLIDRLPSVPLMSRIRTCVARYTDLMRLTTTTSEFTHLLPTLHWKFSPTLFTCYEKMQSKWFRNIKYIFPSTCCSPEQDSNPRCKAFISDTIRPLRQTKKKKKNNFTSLRPQHIQ